MEFANQRQNRGAVATGSHAHKTRLRFTSFVFLAGAGKNDAWVPSQIDPVATAHRFWRWACISWAVWPVSMKHRNATLNVRTG